MFLRPSCAGGELPQSLSARPSATPDLALQVAEERLRIERVSRDLRDDLFGVKPVPHAVDMRMEPFQEMAEFATLYFLLKRMIARIGFHQLCAVNAAKCVGGEIAERPE